MSPPFLNTSDLQASPAYHAMTLASIAAKSATNNLQPPLQGTRRLKIFYATQTGVQPPTFVLFVNDETLMPFSYERYLENYFRKTFPLEGTPIRYILRERNEKEKQS